MVRAGVGISIQADASAAVAEASRAALEQAGAADFAIVFATPGPAQEPTRLLSTAVDVLGTRSVVGASAHGVMGAGLECEGQPSVSVMAVTGLEAEPFLVADARGDEARVGAEIASRIRGKPGPADLIVVLSDPRLDTAKLVHGFDALRPAQIVGAGAGDPFAGSPSQWCGTEVESEAVAGFALRGVRARVGVTQACRPTTELMSVTRVQGNWVLELDGRPALDVYREAALGPLADDLPRAASFVLVALPQDELDPLRPGSYLVRHVIGFSPDNRAFALPETVTRGQRLALAIREPEAARSDLKAMLAAQGGPASLGLYFNCCARGSAFFGVAGLESAYLEHALGDTPIAGMFGSYEVGPIGGVGQGTPQLLTYTGVLALINS